MSFISLSMNTKYNDNATNLTSSGLIEIEFLNQLGKKIMHPAKYRSSPIEFV